MRTPLRGLVKRAPIAPELALERLWSPFETDFQVNPMGCSWIFMVFSFKTDAKWVLEEVSRSYRELL